MIGIKPAVTENNDEEEEEVSTKNKDKEDVSITARIKYTCL